MQAISRVYDTYAQARQVLAELETAGIPSSDISLIANKYGSEAHSDVTDASGAAAGAGVGAAVGGGAGLLAGLGIMAIPGIGPVVAAGWLAATALGAAVGAATGGLVGALADLGVPREHAEVYSEAIRRGGTLVTVRVPEAQVAQAQTILDRHRPIDALRRGEEYRQAGWRGYDPKAAPYTLSEEDRVRIRSQYRP